MSGDISMNFYVKISLLATLAVLLVCPARAEDGSQASGQTAGGNASLKMQPTVITTAATKAMILGTAKAGKRIVAVGDHGIVLLSDDEGATFRQAKSVPVRSTLTAVSFVDDKTGWAVGQWGVILATADGGESWQLRRSDTALDQPLFSVFFKDKDHGWAVGLWSLMLATRDGGKTWSAVQLPVQQGSGKAGRNFLKIFPGNKGALFVAAEQGTVLRSSDDGAGWTFIKTGYKGSFWTGITLKDGTILVGGLRGTIYRSTDDGRSWKEAPSGVKSSITDFAETGGKVFAVGLDGISLESANSGVSFETAQRDDRIPFTALVATDSGRLIAFSKQGVVNDFREEKKK
jgi:photosystem II stability/assembly factor-like uncharacterized protein